MKESSAFPEAIQNLATMNFFPSMKSKGNIPQGEWLWKLSRDCNLYETEI